MKKHLVTIAPKRALTQPTRKAATKGPLASRAKAPAPKAQKTKAEADFDRAVQFRNTCPLLAAAPAAKRRMRAASLAYAAELATKGGKR
mgnify:FL=1